MNEYFSRADDSFNQNLSKRPVTNRRIIRKSAVGRQLLSHNLNAIPSSKSPGRCLIAFVSEDLYVNLFYKYRFTRKIMVTNLPKKIYKSLNLQLKSAFW